MNKYEKLVEYIINDETEKARALFHDIVVEKSRDIYEGLMDEEGCDVGGNKVQDLQDDVDAEESGLAEEELEDTDMDFDDSGDLDDHEEEHLEDEADTEELEDRVEDLEAALDELKAEFDELMAGEAEEEEHADMFGGEEETDELGDEDFGDEEDFGGEEEFDGEMVREYVEKVGDTGQKSEGGEVGAGKKASVNTKTPVASKNPMGGSAKNIAQGDTGADVTAAKAQKMNTGNINVPGGKAGSAFKSKESAKSGEGQTTDKTVGGVNAKSPLAR